MNNAEHSNNLIESHMRHLMQIKHFSLPPHANLIKYKEAKLLHIKQLSQLQGKINLISFDVSLVRPFFSHFVDSFHRLLVCLHVLFACLFVCWHIGFHIIFNQMTSNPINANTHTMRLARHTHPSEGNGEGGESECDYIQAQRYYLLNGTRFFTSN